MANKTNISVIKFDEEAEYTGELTIDLAGENARCMYDLTNFVDSTKKFKGEFNCNYTGLAPIIERIEKLINNTLIESDK
jgi:hypothetical protein